MRGEEKLSTRKDCAPEARKSAADRLCEVATDLFYKRGIRAVGVDEIVCETGVTKPTLYRNYASKDDLVTVCLTKSVEESKARWDAIAAAMPDDPLGQIRAIIAGFADEIGAPDYRGCPMTNAAVEFPDRNHPAREVSEGCKAALRARIVGLARDMAAHDPDALADGLLLLVEGAINYRHTSGSQGPSSALVKTSERLIAAYLAH